MIRKLFKEASSRLHGLFILVLFVMFVLLCVPIYVYRWCLTVLAKRFCQDICKPVTAFGNLFAVEFHSSGLQHPPRSGAVLTTTFDGQLTVEEAKKLINENWLGTQTQKSRYPEFTQYVESWMGFMFWKQDLDFNVNNHVHPHYINGVTDEEVEENVCLFVEDLLNKSFQPKRSPWEFYIVSKYKNDKLREQCIHPEMTLVVFRFHHSLSDGYSMLNAFMEGLLETSISSISLPSPRNSRPTSLKEKVKFILKLPWRGLQEISQYVKLHYTAKTILHVPDDKKMWRQLYARSELIPIEHIKNIKNRLQVSFTGVLCSALAGGLAKSTNLVGADGAQCNKTAATLPFVTILPLPNHPEKLRNHFAMTYLQLPTAAAMGSFERLKNVEVILEKARRSLFPIGFLYSTKLLGQLLAPMTKFLAQNRCFPAGLTNFPGPGCDVYLNNKRMLGTNVVVGALPGVTGIGFMMVSYGNYVQFGLSVEQAVMSRNEAKKVMECICNEIDILYELSKKSGTIKEVMEPLPV